MSGKARKKAFTVARNVALVAGVLVAGTALGLWTDRPSPPVAYSDAIAMITEGKVKEVHVGADALRLVLREPKKPGEIIVVARPPRLDDHALVDALAQAHVVVVGEPEESTAWRWLPAVLLLVVPLLFLWLPGWMGGGRRQGSSFGRSKARLQVESAENATTFAEVAGADEAKAELAEVVRFLKEPARYRAVGARIPKGVLLVGAPGTGKTLLAKAVAGEAHVPFFSLSGSEFVEMFVGVGASRVRDLFEQAKARAPSIVFIDELDAIGKTRSGVQGYVANEEREQTLNQLLVEMDGFESGAGVVLLAATNRPEILDRALLRAGRFDRQVVVDVPDVRGRAAILTVHARKIVMGPDVDLETVSKQTPGMAGADLANLVNEAALASVRRGASAVSARDFEEALDRAHLGLRKDGRVMSELEKRRVALHESGHALVALAVGHADPIDRVTIIPHSLGALGATLQLPATDRYLMTRDELLDRLCIYLGGRAAEALEGADVSTGAADDLERANELARDMVCRFGMSDELGPVVADRSPAAGPWGAAGTSNLGETMRRRIDREVAKLLATALDRARGILTRNRTLLAAIASELLAKESLRRVDLDRITGGGVVREGAEARVEVDGAGPQGPALASPAA